MEEQIGIFFMVVIAVSVAVPVGAILYHIVKKRLTKSDHRYMQQDPQHRYMQRDPQQDKWKNK